MTQYDAFVAEARAEAAAFIDVQRNGTYAIVTLDDPDRLNPLSAPLTIGLREALEDLAREADIRTIVLTGRDPAFSAGGDLRMMLEAAPSMLDSAGGATDIWRWIRNQFGGIARVITRTDKAFIAAINGPAAGVGLAFALACDIQILSEQATLVPAFGRIGLVPEVGSSWALTRRIGYQRTFALYASGRHMEAKEALELGIGNELVAHEQLLPTTLEWVERIEQLPAHVLAMSKPLLRQCADMTWEQAIALEEFAEPMCFTTQAHTDGVRELLAR
jgi:2-(1,2-epoxy-1,2-dihydrophenyl)acetyl-CoA isomerase